MYHLLISLSIFFHISLFFKLSAQTPRTIIEVQEWQQLIPSDKIPNTIEIKKSNCNLDAISYHDHYYLAFRTAPNHFASKKVELHILGTHSIDTCWALEHSIKLGKDIREPRFVVYRDTLFLYFFEGGKSYYKFEPQKLWMVYKAKERKWSSLNRIDWDGYVPWRVRVVDDRLIMSTYYGRYLYSKPETAHIRLLESEDGFHWESISERPQVNIPGAEEGEFIFEDSGKMWGTVRVDGMGAFVVSAHKDSLANWKLYRAIDKYDSPLLFSASDEIFLISRRNPDENFAKPRKWMPKEMLRMYKLLRYSLTTKRTALFILDKKTFSFKHLMDFPSTGDTAYPALIELGEDEFILFNYSNDIVGKDKIWYAGQTSATNIYWTKIKFSSD